MNGERRIKILIAYCSLLIALCFPGCSRQHEAAWIPGTPLARENIMIGIIHPYEIDSTSLYDFAHYMGTLEMQQRIGLRDHQIIRKANVFDGDPAAAESAIRDSIAEGANIIISTSLNFMDVCEQLAMEFTSVVFAQAMGYKHNETNFTNYAMRFYQARYLSGIVAGLRTQTNRIGFVAARGKDNSEVSSTVNAFAMGVESVNPEARIFVRVTHSWFDPIGEAVAANALIAAGCDVIAAYCDTPVPQITAQSAGVWAIGNNSDMRINAPDAVITSVVPNWEVVYTRFVQSVIDGTFSPMLNLYGLGEGAVDITPINLNLAAPGTNAAVEAARRRIIDEGFTIFEGVLETNDGRTIGEEGKTLPDDVILSNIDWYYWNVVEL